MAGRKGTPPKALVLAQTPGITDPALQRAFDVVTRAIQDLQSRRHLEQFTAAEPGYVPESGGNAAYFLAADGVWKSIVGSGAVDSVTAGSSMVTASPTTGAVVVDVVPANFTGIPESGITSLISDLAARPTGSGTSGKSTRWTGTSVLGDGAFLDDGTDVSLAGNLTLSTFAAGSVLFAGTGGLVSQNNSKLFWDNTNNRFGVRTNSPATALDVAGVIAASSSAGGLFVRTTGVTRTDPVLGFTNTFVEFTDTVTNTVIASTYSNTDNAAFQVFRARSAGAAIQSGDSLGSVGFTGATSTTAHHTGAGISATSTENWVTGTNVGTKLDFFTTKNNTSAVTGRQVRLTIDQDGSVLIPGAVNSGTTSLIVGATAATKSGNVGSMEVTRDSANTVAVISCYGTGVNASINLFRGRGTAAATTAVQSTDALGTIAFAGSVGGTGFGSSSFISAAATENWVGGAIGSKLTFTTCLNGSTTRNVKLTIENDGGISLSSSSAAAVSAASQVTLRANTQLQVSENTGAYVTVAKGTGTAGTHVKWSNTTGTLADSLISETATAVTIGTATTQSHTINGRAATTNTTTTVSALSATQNPSAGTTSALAAIVASNTGSYNTTSAVLTEIALDATITASRSAGANVLTNIAGRFTATTGQTNVALQTIDGSNYFNTTSGSTGVGYALGAALAQKFNVSGTSLLDGQVDVNSHKIVNLTNGASAQDAAAFGQIATAVNAAVSGTTNTLAKFTSTNVVGNSSITDDGSVVDVNTLTTKFGTTDGDAFIYANTIGGQLATNANGSFWINYAGYQAGLTQFRDLFVGDGKGSLIATFTGSTKAVALAGDLSVTGALSVSGNVTLGDADTDLHLVRGTYKIQNTGADSDAVQTFQNDAKTWTAGVAGSLSDAYHITEAGVDTWVQVAPGGTMTVKAAFVTQGTTTLCDGTGDTLKFYGGTGATQQTITGSRGGNAALADLLTKLATLGLIVDSTT